MDKFVQIPIWIIFRSGLSPCDIYDKVNGKFRLILPFDTPVPRIWIGKMMRAGVNWLYIRENQKNDFAEYLQSFLSDRFAEEFIQDLIRDGRQAQLVVPSSDMIPDSLKDKFSFKVSEVIAEGDLDAQDFGKIHISGSRKKNQVQYVRGVRELKSKLLMVRSGTNLELSDPDSMRLELMKLRGGISAFKMGGSLSSRLDALDEMLNDMNGEEDWSDRIEDIIGEIESLEMSIETERNGLENYHYVDEYNYSRSAQKSETAPTENIVDYSPSYIEKLEKERDRLAQETASLRDDKLELIGEKEQSEYQVKRLKQELQQLSAQYDQVCEKHDNFLATQKRDEREDVDSSVVRKMGRMEERTADLREENLQTKLALGKAKTVIQDLARQVRVKDSKIEQLTLRISQLSSKSRVS